MLFRDEEYSKIALVFTRNVHMMTSEEPEYFFFLNMYFEIISGYFLGIKGAYSYKKRLVAQICLGCASYNDVCTLGMTSHLLYRTCGKVDQSIFFFTKAWYAMFHKFLLSEK